MNNAFVSNSVSRGRDQVKTPPRYLIVRPEQGRRDERMINYSVLMAHGRQKTGSNNVRCFRLRPLDFDLKSIVSVNS